MGMGHAIWVEQVDAQSAAAADSSSFWLLIGDKTYLVGGLEHEFYFSIQLRISSS